MIWYLQRWIRKIVNKSHPFSILKIEYREGKEEKEEKEEKRRRIKRTIKKVLKKRAIEKIIKSSLMLFLVQLK